MPRKRPDLKARLNELEQQPEPPMDVKLQLDAHLYRQLKTMAAKSHRPVEIYIANILIQHTKTTAKKVGG